VVGIGLGCFVEKSGLGQWEYARVELGSKGEVTVYTGVESLGQGIETALAQICAEVLGVPEADISVIHGDTQLIPYGVGAFASRGAVLGGNAVHIAATNARDRILAIAAELLEAAPGDLSLRGGRIEVAGHPGKTLSLADVGQAALPGNALPRGDIPGVSEDAFFETDELAYPYGIHIAMIEIDRETGVLNILRYVIAYDVGRAINPVLVDGQLVGGLAQGLGGTLLEEFAYDQDGQLLSGSLMDYLLPTALDVPRVEVLLSEDAPSPFNPLGVKGAGEGGTVGAPAALGNAVADALGVPVRELPLSPDRILALVRQADADPTAAR
jgi:carbon-monoxide dehydrogenase large subunit/6-hydroxypseudooxynicotine dehydrogenase subunit gamma